MKESFTKLSQVIEALNKESIVNYRLFLYKEEKRWVLYSAFFDVVKQTKSERDFLYNYGREVFIGGRSSGQDVANWLFSSIGKSQDFAFCIPKLQDSVHSRVTTSGSSSVFLGVEEPHCITEISILDRSPLSNRDLVSPKCPSFITLREGAYSLLFDEPVKRYESSNLPDSIRIRWRYEEVWIKEAKIENRKIVVTISGNNPNGVRLEIRAGVQQLIDKKLRTGGEKTFPIPGNISQEILIIVSRRNTILDHKSIDPRYESIAKSTDPEGELIRKILDGENEHLEFKQEIPSDSTKYIKTVAAFANGEGGLILFGVEKDTTIKGVLGKIDDLKDRITDAICNRMDPTPKFRFENFLLENKGILGLYVEEGDLRPYGISNDKRLDVYVRRGSTTRFARHHEIRELSRKDMMANLPSTFLYR